MSRILLFLFLLGTTPALAQPPASGRLDRIHRHPLGSFAEMAADTVLDATGRRFAPAPGVAFRAEPVGGADRRTSSVSVLDADGDGDEDLFAAPMTWLRMGGGSSMLENVGGELRPVRAFGLPTYVREQRAADLDNDGRCDLVALAVHEHEHAEFTDEDRDSMRARLLWLRRTGPFRFDPVDLTARLDPGGRNLQGFALLQVDGDDRLDLVVLLGHEGTGSPQLVTLLATDDGFRRAASAAAPFGDLPAAPRLQSVQGAGIGGAELLVVDSTEHWQAAAHPLLPAHGATGFAPGKPFLPGALPARSPLAVVDANGDGRFDLAWGVSDYNGGHNQLWLQGPGGAWREAGFEHGLHAGYDYTVAQPWGDLDSDGDLDVFHARVHSESRTTPSAMLRQHEQGFFEQVGHRVEPPVVGSAYCGAWFDPDADGDLDLFVGRGTDYQGANPVALLEDLLLRNEGVQGHALRVELVGTASNRSALGAVLRARIGERELWRRVPDGSNPGLSNNSLRVHLGLGGATRVDELEIRWPSGLVELHRDLPAGPLRQLVEGEGSRLSGTR